MNPLISVIIPVYNRAKQLPNAINSAMQQSYPNIEIIVVDDGSDDDIDNVINPAVFPKLKYVKRAVNGGAGAARNTGIDNAFGDYIAFLDSDDIWKEDKLTKQLRALQNHPDCSVCFCAIERYNYDSGADSIHPTMRDGIVDTVLLLQDSLAGTPAILSKREVLDEYRFNEDLPNLEDYEWVIRASQTNKFFFLQEPLIRAFLSNDSITKYDNNRYIKSHEIILNSNRGIADRYREFKVSELSRIVYYKGLCGIDSSEELLELYKDNPSIIAKARYILAKLHLYSLVVKMSDKMRKYIL